MSDFNHTLALRDFAVLFGCEVDEISAECQAMIARGDWRYEILAGAERDAVILDQLKRVDHRQFSTVVEGDNSRWIKGWGENLKDFSEGGFDTSALVPKYIRNGFPVRLDQQLIKTADPQFELHWYEVFRLWLLQGMFRGFDHIFEFGCGSGFNVATLAELFPQATVHGLDWAQPSVDIVENLRTKRGLNTRGRLFDFFNPDYGVELPPNSAVLTIGALEQTSSKNAAMLEFFLAKNPALVVHVEPIYEWYEPDNLVDYLAIRAHEFRNFWTGYPARLEELAAAGKVEILKRKRSFFGSVVTEGYSQLIWRPKA